MKYITYIIVSIFSFLPFITNAHVKWFAEEITYVEQYKISDPFVQSVIFIGFLIILIGIFLERRFSLPAKFDQLIEKYAPYVLSLASIGFGIAFLIFTIQGFVFAPNLPAHGDFGYLMLGIQLVAGVMMVFGLYERIGGLLLIILFLLGVIEYGFIEMLDTFEMIGFAIYIMIVGRPKWRILDTEILQKITHPMHSYGYPLLRIGTGINLIILGLTEKIFAPALTQNFLSTHNWNFLEIFGVSDYWFAFTAGSVEILFGLFFVLGLVTRLTTLVLAGFLITTLYLLGPVELIGHLPHFSIAIVLLVLGSGSRFIFFKR